MNTEGILELARAVIDTEARAVASLVDRLDGEFARACTAILACKGRVVVLGVGKSGHIGGKIAATLASTGTPAFFVNGIMLGGAIPLAEFVKVIESELGQAGGPAAS